MRIFFTRHGQVMPKSYYKNDPSKPRGNTALSELGQEQARLAGKKLQALGFHGVIFSSPYDRTMQTAELIAEAVGGSFLPLPCIREIASAAEPTSHSAGTGADILKRYPHAEVAPDTKYTWFDEKAEDLADVIRRVQQGIAPVLEALPKQTDVLFVGHAATAVALRHIFHAEADNRGFHWNCHISLLHSSSGEVYTNDSSHLPPQMRTGNSIIYTEHANKWQDVKASIFAFAQACRGNRVLHIGDTHSANYNTIQQLIETIQPNIIIHTGDLADELKAGRIEDVRPYWRATVPTLLKMLEQSSARVIIVPGNNDLEEELPLLAPTAEIVPKNTVLEIDAKRICLSHEVLKLDESIPADYYLYGHGLTGEERTPDSNERNGKKYYNAVWGASLHDFASESSMILPKLIL